MNSLTLRKLAFALPFLSFACEGQVDTADPAIEDAGASPSVLLTVPLAQFGTFYAAATWDSIGPCCAENAFSYSSNWDALAKSQQSQINAYLSRPNTTYDAQRAAECIANVRAAAATCHDYASMTYPNACWLVVHGSVPLGGECHAFDECAQSAGTSTDCTPFRNDPYGPPGRCIRFSPAKEGDPCTPLLEIHLPETGNEFPLCAVGLVCNPGTSTCTKGIAIGEACAFPIPKTDNSHFLECAAGSFCEFTAKTCVPQRPLGSDCKTDPTHACAAGLYCDVDGASKCVPQKHAGETCSRANLATPCESGIRCDELAATCKKNEIGARVCPGLN